MARAFPAARALAVVAAAALTLAACGDDDDENNEAVESNETSSPAANTGDGVLKIGGLLPETGSLAFLGAPQIAAAKLAVQDINDAGGVLGKDVELEFADSGDTKANIANQSADRLLDAGVDTIIGAASSGVTLTVIDKITGSGVLQVSAANTSTELTDYPDQGLYYRTAPSDIYQGRVVAETALDDGAETLGILARQDSYGTSLADQAEKVFEEGGGEVVLKEVFDADASEFSAEVSELAEKDPDAILLIGFAETSKFLDEMVEVGLLPLADSGKALYFTDGNMSNEAYVDRPDGELDGVKGTVPGSKPSDDFQKRLKEFDPDLEELSYAGEAYDAVTLVALAAEAADSDVGKDIAEMMQEVSSGGEKCGTFADCVELLKDGEDIDYDGHSGPIEFDDNGNPAVASMGVYQFGDNNKYLPLKFVSGPIAGGASTTTTEDSDAKEEDEDSEGKEDEDSDADSEDDEDAEDEDSEDEDSEDSDSDDEDAEDEDAEDDE